MFKYLNRFILFIALVALLLTSCKKQLEIDPRQSIDAGTALTSREGIDATITGLYTRLKNARQYGRDLITHPEVLADNGFATNKSGRLIGEANNNFGAHFTGTIWTNSYAAINQINLVLEAIPLLNLIPAVSQAERNNWESQLYFLRGLYYFDLARVYAYIPGAVVTVQDRGGVPLVLKGISSLDSALVRKPSRTPINEVYTQIVSDLTTANSKVTGFPGTADVSISNKAAIQALLSRVNLYRKDYSEAKRWSDSCITLAGGRMTTAATHVGGWRTAIHPEILFQVRFTVNSENIGVNESLQTSFTTLVNVGNPNSLGGFGDAVPTLSLLTDLGITLVGGMTTANYALSHAVNSRNSDVRNLLFEPGSAGRGPVKIECTKYLGKNGSINLDNVPVLRIAEMYLNRAEALATVGSPVFDEAAALADLKFLKSRRYENYAGSAIETADNALTGPALYEEIIRQHRIEFAFEGHRFFDLKRLGRDVIKTPHYTTVAFTDLRILPAILQADVDGNPNLVQNFGY